MGDRYSVGARVGESGAEGSVWVSETSVVCRAGSGGAGSVGAGVTVGERVGSMSEGVSYETGRSSTVGAGNVGTAGGDSVSLSGSGLGSRR